MLAWGGGAEILATFFGGKRKLAPNGPPAWAAGISSPGKRPLEQFSLSFLSPSTRDV